MNRITVYIAKCFALCAVLAAAAFVSSCEKGEGGTPRITEIKSSKGVITGATRGTRIQIVGENLTSPISVTINDHEINMNTVWTADESIFLQIPQTTPIVSEGVVSDKLVVKTTGGEVSSDFFIVPGAPTVTGSTGSTTPGSTLTINGTNIFYVLYVEFSGAQPSIVTEFTTSATGDALTVVVPQGYNTASGSITISALGGNASLSSTPTPPPGGELSITNIRYGATVATTYQLPALKADVQVGDLPYVDREVNPSNTIFSFPESFDPEGGMLMKTSVDGRAYVGGEAYILFDINQEAEVIVAWNQGGMGVIPGWLSTDNGWTTADTTLTDKTLSIQMGTAETKETVWLFRKTFPAGTVELGRNGENSDGTGRNTGRAPYFVIIK